MDKQVVDSKGKLAYLIADISVIPEEEIEQIFKKIQNMPCSIRTRILC